MLFDVTGNRCDEAGDTALHVDSAATIHLAARNFRGKGRMAPGSFIAHRYDIGMTGKHQMRSIGAKARVEIFHVRRAIFGRDHPVYRKAERREQVIEQAERPAFCRRDRRAVDECGKIGDGIGGVHGLSTLCRFYS